MKKKQTHQRAFTLAEVLITIGIIGVVAALTIPTLVNNYQTRSWNISSSNFEAKFGEALKIMNTQQSLSNLGTTERFVNELQKHMKVAKVCNNEELTLCFPDEINGSTSVIDVADPTTYENNSSTPTQTKTIKTAKELGQKDWNTNTMGVQFANGVSAILAYNPKCSANPFDVNAVTVSGDKENITFGTDCVAMVYDTSSNAQPNEKGKDIRTSSMTTIGDEGCQFKVNGKCVTKILNSYSPLNLSQCEAIKDKYGIPCNSDDPSKDYWAAAVDLCGGYEKLATVEDISYMMRYLYKDDNIPVPVTKDGYTTSTWQDNERKAKLGIGSYQFWVNANSKNLGTVTRTFSIVLPNHTNNSLLATSNYKKYALGAICIGD